MSILDLREFLFLCDKAGFKTIGEVHEYMKERNLDWLHLFYELDALLFPQFI